MTDQKSSFAIKFIKRENVLMEAFIHFSLHLWKTAGLCTAEMCDEYVIINI